MKMRRKKSNTSNMWLQNVSLKIDNGPETECKLEIMPTGSHFNVLYIDSRPNLYIQRVKCVLLGGNEMDIIRLLYKEQRILQFRFPNEDSKLQFMESAFFREEDSANSSMESSPSPENI